jgi:hypothetical protein
MTECSVMNAITFISAPHSHRNGRKGDTPLQLFRDLARQHLDRHLPPQPTVAGAIDLAHAALPEAGGDGVVRDLLADQVCHRMLFLVFIIPWGEGLRGTPMCSRGAENVRQR